MIEAYPGSSPVALEQRAELHPRFQRLSEGMSELTFAGIYLFRERHQYRLSRLPGELLVISGRDAEPFFILPFGLPPSETLASLFDCYGTMKAVSAWQAEQLREMGYRTWEDRGNFDYLYPRQEMAGLAGRRLHRKKNLVNRFLRDNASEVRPLLQENAADALQVVDRWRRQQDTDGDYRAAAEAIERMEYLQLCGGVFYIDKDPVAYTLGEELAQGRMFVIHFEKAILSKQHKGLYQYVSQAFADRLPEKYELVNREQDLGDPGLRQAKETYRPVGFVEKYRAAR